MKYIKNPSLQVAFLALIFIGFMLSGFLGKNSEASELIKIKNDIAALQHMGNTYTPSMAYNTASRTLNTPFMISDQRQSIVSYNILITNTATVVLGNNGQVLLETKTGAGSWNTLSTSQSSVGSGLVFSGGNTQSIFGVISRGDSVRIRSNNVMGAPVYGTPTGMEILIN
jgi:hypothetical protein